MGYCCDNKETYYHVILGKFLFFLLFKLTTDTTLALCSPIVK